MSGSELMCNAIGVGVKENREVDARNNYCEQNKREFKQQTCVSDEFVAKSRVTILWRKQLSYNGTHVGFVAIEMEQTRYSVNVVKGGATRCLGLRNLRRGGDTCTHCV